MSEEVRRMSDELARDPSSRVFVGLGEALRRLRQTDLARTITLRGLERHPHLAEAHDLLARISVDSGDLENAFDEWDMVLKLSPGHLGALKGMGFVCFRREQFREAERYLGAAAQSDPSDAEVSSALQHVRALAPLTMSNAADSAESDSRYLFVADLPDEGQTALLLDKSGLVLGGAGGGRRVERRDGCRAAHDAAPGARGLDVDRVRDGCRRGGTRSRAAGWASGTRHVARDATWVGASPPGSLQHTRATLDGGERHMTSPFTELLQGLSRQRGVRAALVASEQDGIVIDSNLQIGQQGDRVAALAASLYRKARMSSTAAGLGAVSFLQLEAPNGRVCVAGAGELVLVVVAAATVNVGLVRVEMVRAAATITLLAGGSAP
jgi:predicted regulator of Ras-like GTPase activity (Roadblock/LC7/MglB family)